MKTQTFRSLPRVLMSKDLVYVHQAFIYFVQCYGYSSVCVYEVLCSRVLVLGHTFDANTRSPFLMRGSDSLDWDCGAVHVHLMTCMATILLPK